jgi:nucleotide-binding universal stress UspA family protein
LALSTLLACLRIDGANADLLAVVSDRAERFGSSVIGVVAKQASAHVQNGGAGPPGATRAPPSHVPRARFRSRGADLLVAAASGRGRPREWAVGGVTRDLLLHAERCVLASH